MGEKVAMTAFKELRSYINKLPTDDEHKKLVHDIEKSLEDFRTDNKKFKIGFEN